MAYLAPIHRGSSVRHAIKLNLLAPDEECLVLARSNRIEIWTHSQDAEGLVMAHSKAIYGRVSIFQRLTPPGHDTHHLFVGTENHHYFVLQWDREKNELVTFQSFVDISERALTDSQTRDRAIVDPTGKYIAMELYEGVLNLTKVIRPRKGHTDYLDTPEQVRISELFVWSTTFLHTESKHPKIALLFQERKDLVDSRSLATYRLTDEKGQYSSMDPRKDRENYIPDLDPGASLLIPVPTPAPDDDGRRHISNNNTSPKAMMGGLIVVGETKMLYVDDESTATVEHALDEASIFTAYDSIDDLRHLLADDYGRLYLLTLLVENSVVTGMEVRRLGQTSKASVLVYLGYNILFVGSHEGDSQVVRLALDRDCTDHSCVEVVQTMPNIAPILDFAIMDLGNRAGETQTNEYSSGQARIVTGSGSFRDGSLRSVRSGVGLQDIGVLGEMSDVRRLFALKTPHSPFDNILAISFITETRVFRFDDGGDVEEVESFQGMVLAVPTILAANIFPNRILQVTPSGVFVLDMESGQIESSWKGVSGRSISTASANNEHVLLSVEGRMLVSLSLAKGLEEVASQDLGENDQVSCINVPPQFPGIGLVGFWNSGSVSILNLEDLSVLNGETLKSVDSAAVPRDIILAQVLPPAQSGPSLFVAMADGVVLTFNVDLATWSFSGKKSIVLGSQQARFQTLPSKKPGLSTIFATCEHPSLIYGFENRINYSAVTAEDASCVCPFNSETFPDSIVVATATEVRISHIDELRRTHVRTLHLGEMVRRIAYSPTERVFGVGSIKRELFKGEEIITNSFRLVDEVMLGELGAPYRLERDTELIETVIRAELPDSQGEPVERFIVGTGSLQGGEAVGNERGRILVFGVDENRSPYLITAHDLKGTCRRLAILDNKIVAALTKTVVMFSYHERAPDAASLAKVATYRTATYPTYLAVNENMIAVGDMMKSMSLVEFRKGDKGQQDQLVEVARHYQSCPATAVSYLEDESWVESDADGNLIILRRNPEGVTLEHRKRLEVTSEANLGEMVNKIQRVDVEVGKGAVVVPRAFLATVEGSIYLLSLITPTYVDLLLRLQARLASSPYIVTPGNLPWASYRAFRSPQRQTDEPFRFVDGELVERFLDLSELQQEEMCQGLGPGVEDVRSMVESLRRMS